MSVKDSVTQADALTKAMMFQDKISSKQDAVSIIAFLENQIKQNLQNNYEKKQADVRSAAPTYSSIRPHR